MQDMKMHITHTLNQLQIIASVETYEGSTTCASTWNEEDNALCPKVYPLVGGLECGVLRLCGPNVILS